MMIYLTEIFDNKKIAINIDHIVAVHKGTAGDSEGKTVVNMTNGHLYVAEEDYDVVAMINSKG